MRLIVRFIISALVLLVLSFILPGFAVVGFGGAVAGGGRYRHSGLRRGGYYG